MLATLGVHEDWGLSRLGKRGRMPISWIFMLASVSAGEKRPVKKIRTRTGTLLSDQNFPNPPAHISCRINNYTFVLSGGCWRGSVWGWPKESHQHTLWVSFFSPKPFSGHAVLHVFCQSFGPVALQPFFPLDHMFWSGCSRPTEIWLTRKSVLYSLLLASAFSRQSRQISTPWAVPSPDASFSFCRASVRLSANTSEASHYHHVNRTAPSWFF